MSEVYAARRARLHDQCTAAGSAAALVSRPANVRYLCGAVPPGAVLLLGPVQDVVVATEVPSAPPLSPYLSSGPTRSEEPRLLVMPGADGDPAVAAADLAAADGADSLAVEEHDLTVARHRALGAAAPGSVWPIWTVPSSSCGSSRTTRRSPVCGSRGSWPTRRSASCWSRSWWAAPSVIWRWSWSSRLVDHGADGPAFPTVVAAGPHAGRPGHLPTDRRVEEGDFLTICLGAEYRGYRCQVGRTFVIGPSPADWQVELYDAVFAAQRAGREALLPGRAYCDVDRVTRQVLTAAGYGDALEPCTGHGVGLEIDEDPRLTPSAMGKLDACVPVTVEPGVHLPGRGGVRIDDTLVVRPEADGGPELLTITTKELLAL